MVQTIRDRISERFSNLSLEQPLVRDVVRCLASGAKDETAARELGLSLRTYQRLVSRIMDELDARSRFQAGYLLAQLERC